MKILVAGWAFFLFIYFKIAIAITFYSDLSIIAALVMAILGSIVIFISSGLYSIKLIGIRGFDISADFDRALFFRVSALPAVGFILCHAIAQRLIVLGFSNRLSEELSRSSYYYSGIISPLGDFLVIISLPLLVHYGSFFLGGARQRNASQ